MQELASEFSQIYWGWCPQTRTAGRGDPLPHPAGRAPRCWDPNLGSPLLFSHGCAPV